MASNRYGQIWHGDHHHINIRFSSVEARLKFQNEFEAYHGSHDHEGDIPIFKNVTSKELGLSTGSRSPEDLVKAGTDADYRITLDGYNWADIHEYHNPSRFRNYFWYHVPTCCVPPTIVVGREFVDSGTLERHELSSIFGDMPTSDFESLLRSVESDGFMDDVIKLLEGKVLDGWHRYRAARELNLIRKLRFQEWNEDEQRDGDPKAFVLARNIERRHLSASQRAQIAVTFNERFGLGNIKSQRSGLPNGVPKSRQALAKQANVGTSTIDRAVQVEKAGRAADVISGEKTASEVLSEREASKLLKRKKQVCKSLWDTRLEVARFYTGDGDTELNLHLTLPALEKGFVKNNPVYAEPFQSAMQRTSVAEFRILVDKVLESETDIKVLEKEHRAFVTYLCDLRNWERVDWSPDTNWILPMIQTKKGSQDTSDMAPTTEESLPLQDALDEMKITAALRSVSDVYFAARAAIEKRVEDLEISEYFYDTALDRFALEDSRIFDPVEEIRKDVKNASLYQHWYEILEKLRKCIEERAGWVTALMPKRELSAVAIVISNNTADEVEMVEFTDETSDEIWCKLEEIPADMREALLKLAIQKIQEARKDAV